MAGFQEGANIKKIKIGDDVRDIGADATNIDLKNVSYSGNQGKQLEKGLTNVVTHLKELNDNKYKDDRITIGNSSEANINSIAIGYYVKANGQYSQAFGYRAEATGDNSQAFGFGTAATGHNSQAFGCGTTATGAGAHAEGYGNAGEQTPGFIYSGASGKYSHSENYSNNAKGDHSHAGGYQSEASHQASFVHGSNLKTASNCEFVIGQYNHSDPGLQQQQRLFCIGAGVSEDERANIITIYMPKSGAVSVKNPGDVYGEHATWHIGTLTSPTIDALYKEMNDRYKDTDDRIDNEIDRIDNKMRTMRTDFDSEISKIWDAIRKLS